MITLDALGVVARCVLPGVCRQVNVPLVRILMSTGTFCAEHPPPL